MLRQLETLQEALWRHAVFNARVVAVGPTAQVSARACGLTLLWRDAIFTVRCLGIVTGIEAL